LTDYTLGAIISTSQTTGEKYMSNEMTTQNPFADILAQMAQAQADAQAAEEGEGYACFYLRGLHPQSEQAAEHGAGTLEVSLSAEEKLYGSIAAVLPVDVIGTVSEKAESNPTPRRWETPFEDEDMQEELGPSRCQSTGNFEPDPKYYGRALQHPDAEGRAKVIVSAGWNSDKLVTKETTQVINEDLDCRECIFGKAWFTEDGQLSLGNACRPTFKGVVNLVGLAGHGLLPADQRGVTAISMYKQASRCMFSRRNKRSGDPHNDTIFQSQVGIPAPMADMIKAKPLGDLPANAAMIPAISKHGRKIYRRYFFPLLVGVKQYQNVNKSGKKKGISVIPFLFNPAESVRKVLQNSKNDGEELFQEAVMQAAMDFVRYMDGDARTLMQEVINLLGQTTVIEGEASERLLSEHFNLYGEYHREGEDGRKEGRVKLTTPFQAPATSDDAEAETEDEQDEPDTVAPIPEVFAKKAVEQEVTQREPSQKEQEQLETLNSLPDIEFPDNFGTVWDDEDED
jgi:hypothetical protein